MESIKDDSRFIHLLKALEAGWEIDEPVLIRSTWRSATGTAGTYHFVLRQKAHDKTTLLSLPVSPELLTFLVERKISVTTI
jgi:hypothetical protein